MAATIRSNDDIHPDINTTPLIDVMLVLLTLLIMTLPMQTHAIKIDTGPGEPTKQPPVMTVGIEFDGTATWNGAPVDRATLHAYLVNAAHQHPQPDIVIKADRLAKYDTVAWVLGDATRAGDTHIGFAQ